VITSLERERDHEPWRGREQAMTSDDIRYLMTAPNEPIARLWEQILREAGIPALVRPGGPGAGAWGSVATFEHGIFVRERDLARAREIVEAEGGDVPET
jgi:Putative prokaryotic signal transducing protein